MALGLAPEGASSFLKWEPAAASRVNPNYHCSEAWFRQEEAARGPQSPREFRKSVTFSSYEWPETTRASSPFPRASPEAAEPTRSAAPTERADVPAFLRPSSTQKERKTESPRKAAVQDAAMEQKLRRFKDFESRLTNVSRPRARLAQDPQFQNRSPLPFRKSMPLESMHHSGRFSYGGAAGARSCSPTARNSEAWWPGCGPDYSWQSLQDHSRDACASSRQSKEAVTAERLRRHCSRKNEDSLECMHVTDDSAPQVGRRIVPHMVIDSGAGGARTEAPSRALGGMERRHVSPGPAVLEKEAKICAKRSSPQSSPRRLRQQEKKHVSEPFSTFGYAAPPPPPPQQPESMLRWSPPVL